MNKPSETKDTITEKPGPNVLGEQELEKASAGHLIRTDLLQTHHLLYSIAGSEAVKPAYRPKTDSQETWNL